MKHPIWAHIWATPLILSLNDDHFKHLGKDLLADFSEAQAKKVLAKLNEYVYLVDGTLLNDIPKL